MALKKSEFSEDEIPIFEEALVYKRGEYWQMRMWLAKEHKYARFSLKTRNSSVCHLLLPQRVADGESMALNKPEGSDSAQRTGSIFTITGGSITPITDTNYCH